MRSTGVLDHGDGLDAREAAVLGKPVDLVADDMAAVFDAAVVGIGGLEGLQFVGRGVVEIAFDVVMQSGLVVLDGEQVVGASIEMAAAILVWHPMASMVTSAPFSSRRWSSSGMAVISLDLMSVASWPRTRRWRDAQAETRCSGWRRFGLGVGAAGSLAVDCDDVRIAVAQAADPGE